MGRRHFLSSALESTFVIVLIFQIKIFKNNGTTTFSVVGFLKKKKKIFFYSNRKDDICCRRFFFKLKIKITERRHCLSTVL